MFLVKFSTAIESYCMDITVRCSMCKLYMDMFSDVEMYLLVDDPFYLQSYCLNELRI